MVFEFASFSGGNSFLYCVMLTETIPFSVEVDVCLESPSCPPRDTERQAALFITAFSTVEDIALVGSRSKIGKFIIPRITVKVINEVSIRDINSRQGARNSSDLEHPPSPEANHRRNVLPSQFRSKTPSRVTSSLRIPRLPLAYAWEVMYRTLFPRQNSSFRIVFEALTQKLNWRQWLDDSFLRREAWDSSLTHGVSWVAVRGSGLCGSCSEPRYL